jgi:formate dehydrogenase iron-sulfur subunit
MARMKFICDAERCIECNGCVTACKNEHEVPWGVNRRRVVTSTTACRAKSPSRWPACTAATRPAWRSARSTASTAPTKAWCCTTRTSASAAATAATPALWRAAVPVGRHLRCARQDGQVHLLRRWPRGHGSQAEFEKYGRNRLAEGKLPACAEMCSTKALLAGDGDVVADIFRNRVLRRGKGAEVWGWGTAYGSAQQGPSHDAPHPARLRPCGVARRFALRPAARSRKPGESGGEDTTRRPTPAWARASTSAAGLEAGRQDQLGAAAQGARPVRHERLHPRQQLNGRPRMQTPESSFRLRGRGWRLCSASASGLQAQAAQAATRARRSGPPAQAGHRPRAASRAPTSSRSRPTPAPTPTTPTRPTPSASRCSPATTRPCGARWARA